MHFYFELLKLFLNITMFKKNKGETILTFCQNNGLAYIKLAQILATQNYGTIFTETDRLKLEKICDNINPLPFSEIQKILNSNYGNLAEIFSSVAETPLGAASISQVHKGVLKDGTEVAIKIKRNDLTSTLEQDLKKLQKITISYISFLKKHEKFQKFIAKHFPLLNLKNLTGFNIAFKLYYKWIIEETNFQNEAQNIQNYRTFAHNVNGKVPNTSSIVIPKVFKDLSNDQIIVIDYIPYPNFNKTHDNEAKAKALNSYIALSFYALFHDIDVYFHGDPHNGNLFLDENGNLGFLDMGLLFKLSKEDIKLTKTFFLAAYTRNYEKIFNLLLSFGEVTEEEKENLHSELKNYCKNINTETVTAYFINLIPICLKYNIAPPDFLFCMAKAFICLNGINTITSNNTSAYELLEKQTFEYILAENFENLKKLGITLTNISPTIINSAIKFTLHKTIPEQNYLKISQELKKEETRKALNDALDFLQFIKNLGNDYLKR